MYPRLATNRFRTGSPLRRILEAEAKTMKTDLAFWDVIAYDSAKITIVTT